MSSAQKDRFAIGSADWVRDQVYRWGREHNLYLWCRDVFTDRVVIEADGRLLEMPYTINGDALVLGEEVEVTVTYAVKGLPNIELAGPIVHRAEAQRIVIAPVLVPDEPDSDGDVVKAADIERVAHLWMEKYQNLDLMHTLNNVAQPLESYIAPADLEFPGGVVPKGSWVLAARVPKELWPYVVKGQLTGFSLMGVPGDGLAAAIKSEAALEAAWKRTTIADLGEGWVVPFVSIVDAPAVPKAKFVAIKSKPEPEPSSPDNLVSKLRGLLTGDGTPRADKEGRRFSNATYNNLKAAVEALSALLDEAEKERKKSDKREDVEVDEQQVREIVKAELTEALGPLTEAVAKLAGPASGDPTPAEPVIATLLLTEDAGVVEEVEALKAQVATLTTQVEDATAFRTEVEARLKATPKGLTGQDGPEPEPVATGAGDGVYLDAFGRKYRRDGAGRAKAVVE